MLDTKRGREFELECRVEKFDFSGHATREQIADYAVKCDPSRVILVHGDESARGWLREEIQRRLPRAEVCSPGPGETVYLQ